MNQNNQLTYFIVFQAERMIDRVRTAFKENLKELSWMDEETRLLAESKADAISDMIGRGTIRNIYFIL